MGMMREASASFRGIGCGTEAFARRGRARRPRAASECENDVLRRGRADRAARLARRGWGVARSRGISAHALWKLGEYGLSLIHI